MSIANMDHILNPPQPGGVREINVDHIQLGPFQVIPPQPTKTETQLVSVYGPLVPLDKVCDVYFKLGIDEAKRKALRNALPVPTFRMTDSQKAPLMIKAADLAHHIDTTHAAAYAEWVKSQK